MKAVAPRVSLASRRGGFLYFTREKRRMTRRTFGRTLAAALALLGLGASAKGNSIKFAVNGRRLELANIKLSYGRNECTWLIAGTGHPAVDLEGACCKQETLFVSLAVGDDIRASAVRVLEMETRQGADGATRWSATLSGPPPEQC